MINNIILASSSIRKKLLLNSIGYKLVLNINPLINGLIYNGSFAYKYINYTSFIKTLALSTKYNRNIIISSISYIITNHTIISYPKTIQNAVKYYESLSGKKCTIYTALCIFYKKTLIKKSITTKVKFKFITKNEIKHFIFLKNWKNTYSIYYPLGLNFSYISDIRGSFSNTLGFPLYDVNVILKKIKIRN